MGGQERRGGPGAGAGAKCRWREFLGGTDEIAAASRATRPYCCTRSKDRLPKFKF